MNGKILINLLREKQIILASTTSLAVPDMSYSSSEGEDDFFDANDSPFTAGSQVVTPT